MIAIIKFKRPISLVVLLSLLFQLGAPLQTFSITGGPSMPEYRSFEPVATTNMVSMFDGSLTYNIPLLDVPNGYPLNLAYHSNDVNNEAQASWVGLGWTLNPGAINRTKRGFPDEYNGAPVTYHNRMQANWTVGGGVGLGVELFGNGLSLGLNSSIRYNNYNGVGTSVNLGVGIAGVVSMDFSYAQGRFGFNPEINPAALFHKIKNRNKGPKNTDANEKADENKIVEELKNKGIVSKDKDNKEALQSAKQLMTESGGSQSNQVSFKGGGFKASGGAFGMSFSHVGPGSPVSFSTTSTKYNGFMADVKVDFGVNFLPAPIDPEASISGSFSIQKTVEQQSKSVFGYMNNESGDNDPASMMDYFTENDSPFEKRDNILGYPVPNNDVYSVSGEGMNGSFRSFRSEFGTYRVDKAYSDDIMINVGLDFNLPSFGLIPGMLNFTQTTGVEVGGSYHFLDIGDWDQSKLTTDDDYFKFISKSDVANSSNENWFFRYSGDLGGNFDVVGNDAPYKVGLDPKVLRAELDYSNWSNVVSGITNSYQHTRDNKRRSSYVGYNTYADVTASSHGIKYRAYEKKLNILTETAPVDATNPRGIYAATPYSYSNISNSSSIQEIASTNPDGFTYVYGLPVYARNEKQLSYALRDQDFSAANMAANGYQYIPGTDISNNNLDNSAKRKIGYESNTSYVTTHLLTQIVSPDYIDRLMDGPTEDDFGSYTKINYVRIHGGTDWFSHRSPYNGLNFSYGSLSSNKDDAGSFTYGEKEIYFIRSVESKTHVAIFTLTDREDGASAQLNNSPSANDLAKGYKSSATKKPLKKLSKIELYSRNDLNVTAAGDYEPKDGATPIKTVRFDYTYDLCDGIPNNTASNGKLTLKKLWFEYEGKLTKKISPYEFYYEYPNTAGISNQVVYPAPYAALNANSSLSLAEQNPTYKLVNTDRWGNYRDFSQLNTALGNLSYVWPYVDQNSDYTNFDPAAHQLKRIVLPSRGEIHIQYEQNDYMYVQDQKASVMVPLKNVPNTTTDEDEGALAVNGKNYYLDVAKIGISGWSNLTTAEMTAITDELFEPMRVNKDRIYFNFLYSLLNSTPDITSKKSEYLEGFSRIQGYGCDATGPFFVFKGSPSGTPIHYHAISYSSNVSQREVPRKVCHDFYNTQRRGMINGESNSLDAAAESGTTAKGLLEGFVSLLQSLTTLNCCAQMRPEFSYVRVQFPTYKVGKKGGGVRVKRLLMYDAGIENNNDVLYGNEYSYTTNSGNKVISSGVATNEPEMGRKENSLVKIIDKDVQSTANAILFGRDMYSQEGPLGESLLPSPTVGYSKVTVNNIHKGRTSTGSEVHEFYTCKDYPFRALKTTIEKEFNVPVNISFGAGGFSFSYSRHNPYLSQGYSFISNGMHGQPKRIAKYANGVSSTPMAEEMYEYYTQTDNVNVMDENLNISSVPIGYLGKETEILAERRQVTDVAIGAHVGADITVGGAMLLTIPPFPLPAFYSTEISAGASVNEKILHTHVTSKIINYPSIVKKVINKADGVTNVTENLVIDKFTGKPIVTRTYDEYENNNYKSNYLTQNFMAGYNYQNMRPKSLNQGKMSSAIFKRIPDFYLDYTVTLPGGGTTCNAYEMNKFIEGDLVHLVNGGNIALFHVSNVNYTSYKVELQSSGINAGTVPINDGTTCSVEILRSGYTNILNSQTGSVVFNLNDPSQANFLGVTSGNPSLNPINSTFLANLNAALVYAINHPSQGTVGYGQQDPHNPVVAIPDGMCAQMCTGVTQACSTKWTPTGSPVPPYTIYDLGLEIHNPNTAANPYLQPINVVPKNMTTGYSIWDYCFQTLVKFGPGWHESFYFDANGNLLTGMPGCSSSNTESCFKLCTESAPALNRVVTATSTTYKNNWDYLDANYPVLKSSYTAFAGDEYEKGKKGKWRSDAAYVYRSKLNPNSEAYTFNKGTFTLSNAPSSKVYFDWFTPANSNSKWVETSISNKYHPNGNANEDQNILEVKSTAKFGYNYSLPVLIAKNAPEDGVAFEGFETQYNYTGGSGAGNYFEDDVIETTSAGTWSSTVAHTGKYSVNLIGGNNYKVASLTPATSNDWTNIWDVQQGLQVRVWVYLNPAYGDISSHDIYARFNADDVEMKLITSAGQWHLYEATYKNSSITSGTLPIYIRSVGSNNIFIDDVRVQPLKSEMVCYVYDKAHRLIATMDDQHFASLFEYNSEGLLVRKLKETTQGIKTISETQYNSKGVNR